MGVREPAVPAAAYSSSRSMGNRRSRRDIDFFRYFPAPGSLLYRYERFDRLDTQSRSDPFSF